MWSKLFRAEWRKIMGNRRTTGLLIGIFPLLAILITVFFLLAAALSSDFRSELGNEFISWTDAAIIPLLIPNNVLGMGLLIAFTAVLFGGEYQWNTWKVIVPRSRRVPLVITKFVTVAVFVVLAFTLTSILATVGMGLVAFVVDVPYGALNGDVLTDFVGDYGLQVLNAFLTTIIAASYAALAAMITRSILGSIMIRIDSKRW